eukprot:6697788-Pyramimonas_sp.AAC.1
MCIRDSVVADHSHVRLGNGNVGVGPFHEGLGLPSLLPRSDAPSLRQLHHVRHSWVTLSVRAQ